MGAIGVSGGYIACGGYICVRYLFIHTALFVVACYMGQSASDRHNIDSFIKGPGGMNDMLDRMKRIMKDADAIDLAEKRLECKTHADARVIAQLHLDRLHAQKVEHVLSELDAALQDHHSACQIIDSIHNKANEMTSANVCNLLFQGRMPITNQPGMWTTTLPPLRPSIVVPVVAPPSLVL